MKNLLNAAAAVLLVLGVIYFMTAAKDDAEMAVFKQSVATFIRSDKKSAPLRDVLGRGGDRICVTYDAKGGMEITIQDYKALTVMKGRRDVIVDGKSYDLMVSRDCFNFSTATFRKAAKLYPQGRGTKYLVIEEPTGKGQKTVVNPKQEKKSAPPPVKKATKPVRSYGY